MSRPFGVALLVAGCDRKDGCMLYFSDPSGTFFSVRYVAIDAPTLIYLISPIFPLPFKLPYNTPYNTPSNTPLPPLPFPPIHPTHTHTPTHPPLPHPHPHTHTHTHTQYKAKAIGAGSEGAQATLQVKPLLSPLKTPLMPPLIRLTPPLTVPISPLIHPLIHTHLSGALERGHDCAGRRGRGLRDSQAGVCVCVCVCACVYVCMYVCIYVCMIGYVAFEILKQVNRHTHLSQTP
jgi:hypothetical protein